MARGDNLQLDVKGLVTLAGPPDGESAARSELETKLRVLFANLNDPLVCVRFAGTGIADKTAEQLARSPRFRYRVMGGKAGGKEASSKEAKFEPKPFVADRKLTRRLLELSSLGRGKTVRGKKAKAALEVEAKSIARKIGTARVAWARKEDARLEAEKKAQAQQAKTAKRATIKVFIHELDVKYRNPPNMQWKWWARVRNDVNTIAPGTFTSL